MFKVENPLLVDSEGGFSVYYRNKFLYSSREPRKRVEKQVKSCILRENTLIFAPSPLLGYGLDILIKNLPPNCHIISVEADEKLMSLSAKYIPQDLKKSPYFTLLYTDSVEKVVKVIHDLGVWNFRRAEIVILSGGFTLYGKVYRNIFSSIQREIQTYWQNKMTLIHMARLWIDNIFFNLCSLPESHSLKEFNIHKPVLVAGAGESLEDSLHLIEKFRENLFILCVDTALPVLLQSGIKPDLIVILESQFINLLDFSLCNDHSIPIVCDLTSYPGVVRLFSGRKYFFLTSFAGTKLITRLKEAGLIKIILPPLGSVGITAVLIALSITKGYILLTGLDFSYKPGKPHARGAASHIKLLSELNRFKPMGLYDSAMKRSIIKVKDKSGNYCVTDLVLYSYSSSLRDITRENPRIFDLSKIGIETGAVRCTDPEKLLAGVNRVYTEQLTADINYSLSKEEITGFLKKEIELMEEIISLGNKIIFSYENRFPDENLFRLLKECDYLYLDLPDTPPLPKKEVSFLARCIISANHYKAQIDKALCILTSR